uniref:Intracellular protein T/Ecp52I-1 n=1 Tax=Gallus gallus TaxID=9031 RepID=A1KXM4_CHICK|nr:intracellular protein T/Ecp52I-1 [Gallus gallus]
MGKGMHLVGNPMDGHRHHYQQPPTGDGPPWVLPIWGEGSEHPFSMQKLLVCAISPQRGLWDGWTWWTAALPL